MNKQTEYDIKCGIAIDFLINEEFRKEIYSKNSLEDLSAKCREFVELCYRNKDKFRKELFENFQYPKDLEKYSKYTKNNN